MKNIKNQKTFLALKKLILASEYLDSIGLEKYSEIVLNIANETVFLAKNKLSFGKEESGSVSYIPELTLKNEKPTDLYTPFDVTEKYRIQTVIDVLESIRNGELELKEETDSALHEFLNKIKSIFNRDKNVK